MPQQRDASIRHGIHLIARQERCTIREMEGLVNRVTAYASLTGQPITSDLGVESLREQRRDAIADEAAPAQR